jgi:hypothetical protein
VVKLADIKTKQKSDIKIKKFNKAQVYTQKLKNNIVNVKNKSDYTSNNNEESTPTVNVNIKMYIFLKLRMYKNIHS